MGSTGQMMKNASQNTCPMRKIELRREIGVHGGKGKRSKVSREEGTVLQRRGPELGKKVWCHLTIMTIRPPCYHYDYQTFTLVSEEQGTAHLFPSKRTAFNEPSTNILIIALFLTTYRVRVPTPTSS